MVILLMFMNLKLIISFNNECEIIREKNKRGKSIDKKFKLYNIIKYFEIWSDLESLIPLFGEQILKLLQNI